jgi:DNA-binding NarL/FixJ family response regulator
MTTVLVIDDHPIVLQGIAEQLNVSYKTVVNSCAQLRQKLDAHTLPELIRSAVRLDATPSSPS